MSLFAGIALIVLTVISTAISALLRIRKSSEAGPAWRNLTGWGVLLFILFLVTVPLSIVKLISEEYEKARSEAKLQETLQKTVQETLDKYGLTLADLKEGKPALAIKNLNLLYRFIDRANPPTRPEDPRIIHDTVLRRGKDSIIVKRDTIRIQIPCPETKQESGKTDRPDPPPVTPFTSVLDKSLRNGGDSHHQTYARIIFQNLLKSTIHMYSAGIVGGGGEFVNAMGIASGGSRETNPLFVCYEDFNKPNQLETPYKFFFYTEDENHKKTYGSFEYSVKPYTIYTIPLNTSTLIMSENGDKDMGALQRAGIY